MPMEQARANIRDRDSRFGEMIIGSWGIVWGLFGAGLLLGHVDASEGTRVVIRAFGINAWTYWFCAVGLFQIGASVINYPRGRPWASIVACLTWASCALAFIQYGYRLGNIWTLGSGTSVFFAIWSGIVLARWMRVPAEPDRSDLPPLEKAAKGRNNAPERQARATWTPHWLRRS